ncbi:MAG: hypothetical protein GY757_61395, partial [bacterium]|nr:hypothetical protein [bacterium]
MENLPEDIHNPKISLAVYYEAVKDYAKELNKGMKPVYFCLVLLGIPFWLIKKPDAKVVCFLLFPFLFASIAIYLNPGYSEIRHQVIIYPFLLVCGAFFFVECLDRISGYGKMAYLLIIILFLPLYPIIEYNMFISRQDTRNLARNWIESNIPSNTKLLVDEAGPYLLFNEESLGKMLGKAEKSDPKGAFTAHYGRYIKYQLLAAKGNPGYNIQEIRWPWWRKEEV